MTAERYSLYIMTAFIGKPTSYVRVLYLQEELLAEVMHSGAL